MRKRGFTLIELLVVIAIIGILATLMFMGYRTVRQKARDSARKSNIRGFMTAMEVYMDAKGHYPSDADTAGAVTLDECDVDTNTTNCIGTDASYAGISAINILLTSSSMSSVPGNPGGTNQDVFYGCGSTPLTTPLTVGAIPAATSCSDAAITNELEAGGDFSLKTG